MGAELLQRPPAIEIRIGTTDLASKLDALGAAVAAVREAHRDTMSVRSWAAMNRAQDFLAEALLTRNEGRMIEGGQPSVAAEIVVRR